MNLRSISIMSMVAALLVSAAIAQERKIRRPDLPPAVEKTAAAQSSGAMVKVFPRKRKEGRSITKRK